MPHNFLIFLSYLLVCAGVTYLIRLLPLLFIRKKIKNRFIRSFLHYVPYSVLTVMAFPAIFHSTGYIASAFVGFAVSILLAVRKKSLIIVAAGASAAVLAVELLAAYTPLTLF